MDQQTQALMLEHAQEKLEMVCKQRDLFAWALLNALDGTPDHHIQDQLATSDEDTQLLIQARQQAQRIVDINERAKNIKFGE